MPASVIWKRSPGTAGSSGQTLACTDGDTQSCGSAVGACKPGTQVCHDGVFGPCHGAVGPTDEVCNGIDDDCDDLVDDDDPDTVGDTVFYVDADLDGYGSSTTALAGTDQISVGEPVVVSFVAM